MVPGRSLVPRLSRRKWAALLAAAPVLGQVTTPSPQASSTPNSAPAVKLDKAVDDIRSTSRRLAAIEVPMDLEPAFSFKA